VEVARRPVAGHGGDDALLALELSFHRRAGAVKDDDVALGIRQRFRRVDDLSRELLWRYPTWPGHAKAGRVNVNPGRRVAVDTHLLQPVLVDGPARRRGWKVSAFRLCP
jgi:hypothetical protein